MNEQTYNGWANWETWVLWAWLTNDHGTWTYWMESAKHCLETYGKEARFELASQLEDEIVGESNPLLETNSLYSDLLLGALRSVNWKEIAHNLLEDCTNE